VDPTCYEKYIQEISAESTQSNEAFLLDPFSEEEHHSGPFTPPFAPSLMIATTPGSIDSDDQVRHQPHFTALLFIFFLFTYIIHISNTAIVSVLLVSRRC
jgi:hypothetical protein